MQRNRRDACTFGLERPGLHADQKKGVTGCCCRAMRGHCICMRKPTGCRIVKGDDNLTQRIGRFDIIHMSMGDTGSQYRYQRQHQRQHAAQLGHAYFPSGRFHAAVLLTPPSIRRHHYPTLI